MPKRESSSSTATASPNSSTSFSSSASSSPSTSSKADHPSEIDEDVLPKNPFRRFCFRVFRTLEDASSSKLARAISIIIILFVLLSTITFIIGSLPQYWEEVPPALKVIEYVVIITFTVEYGLRLLTCWTHYKPWVWFFKPLNIIDLVAIVPFYIELGLATNVSALAAVRILRLFRIIRLFKLGKYSAITFIIIEVFKRAGIGLAAFSFLILFVVIVLASLVFFAETSGADFDNQTLTWTYRDNNATSSFQSIPDAMWYVIVSMTTVGYGDLYPRTPWGRFVGSLTIAFGILTVAFPVTIVGVAMSEVWAEFKDKKKNLDGEEKTVGEQIALLLQQVVLKQGELEAMRQPAEEEEEEEQTVRGVEQMEVVENTDFGTPEKRSKGQAEKKKQKNKKKEKVRHRSSGNSDDLA